MNFFMILTVGLIYWPYSKMAPGLIFNFMHARLPVSRWMLNFQSVKCVNCWESRYRANKFV